MYGEMLASSLRSGMVATFVRIINELPGAGRRDETIWLLQQAAEILTSPGGNADKIRRLDHLLRSSKMVGGIVDLVRQSMASYRESVLPKPLKIAFPTTLMALPLFGAHGVGMAALGGILGAPSLVLAFLGAAGIASILDAVVSQCDGARAVHPQPIPKAMAGDTRPREVVRAGVHPANSYDLPRDETLLRRALQDMNPFDFERHVMGFFSRSGMEAWVTAKTNDMGVDGFARHPRGLIVVQCKRHSTGNLVGRPVIQQMKGVVAEHNALRGYLVTTSRFSDKARHSAKMSDQLVLVDMPELVRWHLEPPRLCA
jgi:restriction system protein